MAGPVPIADNPREIIKTLIVDNMTLEWWTNPLVNRAWFESKRVGKPQITIHPISDLPKLAQLDKTYSSVDHVASYLLSVHAPTREKRWEMIQEVRRIFNDPALTRKPESSDIHELILDEENPIDLDRKKGSSSWRCDWVVRALYGEEIA